MIRKGEVAYPVERATAIVGGKAHGESTLHDPIYDAFVARANALLLARPAGLEQKLFSMTEKAFQDAGKNLQFEPTYSLLCTATQLVQRHGLDTEGYERLFLNIRSYAGSVFQDAVREVSFEFIPDDEFGSVLLMAGTLLRREEGQVRVVRYHASPSENRCSIVFTDIGTSPSLDEAVKSRRKEKLIESLVKVEAPGKWSLERTVFPVIYHTFPRLPGLTSSPGSA